MAEPPSYEESTLDTPKPSDQKRDLKTPQPWSIRETVGLSRTQHVASIVSQIVDHIRERATQGLSKTTLVLIPSDQEASRKGAFIGFPNGEIPAMIQFEGRQNSTQFWLQDEALAELKWQLRLAVSDGVPTRPVSEGRPEERPLPLAKKSSWFGRNKAKAQESVPVQEVQSPAWSPVVVDVQLDEIHFRSESEFGLFETLRARVVVAIVDVR